MPGAESTTGRVEGDEDKEIWGLQCFGGGGVDQGACLVAQMVKNLPVTRGTWGPSWGRKAPLEAEMATHCSILAWRIPWPEELAGQSPWGRRESDTTEQELALGKAASF